MNVLGLFLDVSKAFDTVDHGILLKKLENYGIRGIALSLPESYLQERKQYVRVGNMSSISTETRMGVPRGSILGPILFVININDLPLWVGNEDCLIMMYADDTTLIFSKKIDARCNNNHSLAKLIEWFRYNRLSLNIEI